MDIKFSEAKHIYSQRTLVKILKGHKYYFKPINDYTDELYYCIIKCEQKNMFSNFLYKVFKLKIFDTSEKYFDTPIEILVSGFNYQNSNALIVDKNEINNIIKDVPENYVGGKVI